MRPSPKLRPTCWDAVLSVGIIALAALCAVLVWGGGNQATLEAVISIDGTEADRVRLTEAACRTYSNNGYTLTVEFCPAGTPEVMVASSDCPGQDCVHTGAITRSGQSIVCLPARISITLTGGTAAGPDAVIG